MVPRLAYQHLFRQKSFPGARRWRAAHGWGTPSTGAPGNVLVLLYLPGKFRDLYRRKGQAGTCQQAGTQYLTYKGKKREKFFFFVSGKRTALLGRIGVYLVEARLCRVSFIYRVAGKHIFFHIAVSPLINFSLQNFLQPMLSSLNAGYAKDFAG